MITAFRVAQYKVAWELKIQGFPMVVEEHGLSFSACRSLLSWHTLVRKIEISEVG